MEDVLNHFEVKEKIVNFLTTPQQQYDWRYQTSQHLSLNQTKVKYWIATVFLSEVTQKERWYPLKFLSQNGQLVNYGEFCRHVDGAISEGRKEYCFDLSGFKTEMLKAKKEGYFFFSIFIEETVNNFGVHEVSELYINRSDGTVIHGIHSHMPWYKMPVEYFLEFSSFKIDDKVSYSQLLYQGDYNWLK